MATIDDKFIGHWKMDRHENIDEYLKANNVNIALRQVAKFLSVKLEVTKDGDEWTWFYKSTFKNVKLTFKLGVPFEETLVDGRKMNSVYTMEGNDMVCHQTPIKDEDLPSKFINGITEDGELIQHIISVPKDVRAVRYFKRLPSPS